MNTVRYPLPADVVNHMTSLVNDGASLIDLCDYLNNTGTPFPLDVLSGGGEVAFRYGVNPAGQRWSPELVSRALVDHGIAVPPMTAEQQA